MKKLYENLQKEYDAFRTLCFKAEGELGAVPAVSLQESCYVLDHIMKAATENREGSEIQKAKNHLIRGAKDLYLMLLSSRLDQLSLLLTHLSGDELNRFKEEYAKIREMVEYVRSDSQHHKYASDYLKSLSEIDSLIASYSQIESSILLKQKVKIDKYKNFLIAILSALVGAVVSLIVNMLSK